MPIQRRETGAGWAYHHTILDTRTSRAPLVLLVRAEWSRRRTLRGARLAVCRSRPHTRLHCRHRSRPARLRCTSLIRRVRVRLDLGGAVEEQHDAREPAGAMVVAGV